ncbi:MAG: hypothetical protein D6692_10500 [Planctomycetota bacterium]|nr:MAG: hypothetical protein D6692_10500 [Planctomycetota bacterium]
MGTHNQVLVYDISAGRWVGVWEGALARAQGAEVYAFGEAERLLVVGEDGYPFRGLVDGAWDDNGEHPGLVYEREVDLGDGESAPVEVVVDGEHMHGAWAVYVLSDKQGVGAGPVVRVPSVERMRRWAVPPVPVDNDGNRQLEPGRENYAVVVSEPQTNLVETILETDDGTAIVLDTGETIAVQVEETTPSGVWVYANGLFFGVRQSWREWLRLRAGTRRVLVRLQSLRGMVSLQRIGVSAVPRAFGRG